MSSTITRHYGTSEQAAAAVKELEGRGFTAESIAVIGPSGDAAASLRKAGVAPSAAKAYAEAMTRGGTTVTVRAPFGSASLAIEMMEKFNPTDLGIDDTYRASYEFGAAFSSLLGLPVLSSNPTPLSSAIGMPALSYDQDSNTRLMRDPGPLSGLFGLPLLSRNRPKTSSFGLPLLSGNATPLSSMLGLKVLSRNPAPLSSMFGIKLLSN
jgi:hypothetical protein